MPTHGNNSSFRVFITLTSASLRRFGVVLVVRAPLFAVGVFVDRLDVVVVDRVEVFTFAFGVVVSFSVFFLSAAAVLDLVEFFFGVVFEEVDEVFLRERVEDTLAWVVFVPLDDELSFAFLGDIDHEIECWTILPLNSVT